MLKFTTWLIITILSISSTLEENVCLKLVRSRLEESDLIEELSKNMHLVKNESNNCIETILRSGNFKALEYFLNELNKRGIKFRETLSVAINNIQKSLEDLHNKYRFDESEFQKVSPAFQWAQSMSHIYIQIKFAHRHDSPGCLEVKNETVDIYKNLVVFTAYCVLGDVPIKFELNLDMFAGINKEESNWFFSSVGRYQLNLKKETSGMYWDKLLREGVDNPHNMKVWWEMRAKYEDEIKSYLDEDYENEFNRELKEMENEVKGKKKKKNDL